MKKKLSQIIPIGIIFLVVMSFLIVAEKKQPIFTSDEQNNLEENEEIPIIAPGKDTLTFEWNQELHDHIMDTTELLFESEQGPVYVDKLGNTYFRVPNGDWAITFHAEYGYTEPRSLNNNESLEIANIYNIWVDDPGPDVPHATFKLSPESWYIVDSDGDGDRSYNLNGNRITVYFDDFEVAGTILQADGEILVIHWDDSNEPETYYLWKN